MSLIKVSFKIISLLLLFSTASEVLAQQEIEVQNMRFTGQWLGDSLEITLEAPTQGWLAVGFNLENTIVGSDLLMLTIHDGKVLAEDQFVLSFQKHPKDSQNNLRVISAVERGKSTVITFRIPCHSRDSFDFHHQKGKDFWIILAYSVSDDFDHHSIMRKHVKFRWEL